MRSWFRLQRFALANALAHIRRAPGNFLLNAAAIAIALALPFTGFTAFENMRPVSQQLSVEPEISMFLSLDMPRERALALAQDIRAIMQDHRIAATAEFVPRESALNALKNRTGLSDALTTLGTNPLPDSYVLKPADIRNAADAARLDKVAAQLKALPGVEYVQIDSAWVQRLAALMNILRLLLLALAAALGTVVVAVAFNTIRLQVMTQHEEIEISRLLGATDGFIYRPFYYSGALLGLCAGLFALLGVALALQPLNTAIAEFARLYASEFRLTLPPLAGIALLLAASGLLGLIGAALSVRRYLSSIGR